MELNETQREMLRSFKLIHSMYGSVYSDWRKAADDYYKALELCNKSGFDPLQFIND